MKKILSMLLLLGITIPSFAAKVDTLMVKSNAMNKEVQVVVVVPDVALGNEPKNCPVIYLLHGYGGNAKSWISIKPDLPKIADEKGIMIVCPDGKNSWYWDSPQDSTYRYETFVAAELVDYIDKNYATIANRNGRAITGLSMGGHGGMWVGIRHKNRFGACGSTSGGVDIRPFPGNWGMSEQLGDYENNKEVWNAHTVIEQLDGLKSGELAIIIDCGENDFFLEVNKNLHQQLLNRKIDHDFITRPGGHDLHYWNNSVDYQILFFQKFFSR